jgi:hypothetical protein
VDTPTATPELATEEATTEPEQDPTDVPTEVPTDTPTTEPTEVPTDVPTEVPTEIPTDIPTEVPTEVPTDTPVPAPVQRELVLNPIADSSVSPANPDSPQDPALIAQLSAGGTDAAIAYLTFSVEGVASGTVLNAQLVLTGSGDAGAVGGTVGALSGVVIDEYALTYNTAPAYEAPAAIAVDGTPAQISWIDPGAEVWLDVTGTVTADSTVTFVLTGTPDAVVAFASRESATPPRLILTVQDPPQT